MNYIDRGEAMNLLNEAQVEYDENYKGLGLAKKIISDMKPVKPERPKGKWLSELSLYGERKDKYECSICHRTIKVDPLHESLCDYPFCHCGADMRGVSE